jgi:RND superfamily putative drug exporter
MNERTRRRWISMQLASKKKKCCATWPWLVLVALVQGCAGEQFNLERPHDVALTPDSQPYLQTYAAAQQMAGTGHARVSAGRENLRQGQEKIRAGERMLAEGARQSQKAVDEMADASSLALASERYRLAEQLIDDGRRQVETAQQMIKDGRTEIDTATEMLQDLDADRADDPIEADPAE